VDCHVSSKFWLNSSARRELTADCADYTDNEILRYPRNPRLKIRLRLALVRLVIPSRERDTLFRMIRMGRMRSTSIFIVLVFSSAVLFASEYDFFEKKVRPVLVEQCYRCHSAATNVAPRLDSREAALKTVVADGPEKSPLIRILRGESKEIKEHHLSEAQIADFTEWANMVNPAQPADSTKPRVGEIDYPRRDSNGHFENRRCRRFQKCGT